MTEQVSNPFGISFVDSEEVPDGMNLFVLSSLLPDVPTPTLFRGVIPFVIADIVRLGILIAFPAISLWLPSALNIAGG